MRIGKVWLGAYPIRGGIHLGLGAWTVGGQASVRLELLLIGLEVEWDVPDERRRCCELTPEDFWRASETTGGFVVRLAPADRTTVEVVSQDPEDGHVHHYMGAGEARFLGNVLHRQAAGADQRMNHWDDKGETLLPQHRPDICSACRVARRGTEG